MHTLTCLCIRQQDLSALKEDGVSEYILNASFLMTTAATVGYGDSTVDHDAQDPETTYLFGISIMISALIFFSFMQTTFSSLFKKVSAAKAVMENEYSQIEEWIIVRNRMGVTAMPRKLEKMVKGYLRYVSQHDSGIVINSEYHGRLAYSTQIKLEKVLFHNVVIQFKFLKQLANEQLAGHMLKSATTEWYNSCVTQLQ